MKIKCDYCGKNIERKLSRIKKYNHHFCNTECKTRWRKKNEPRGKDHWKHSKIIMKCDFCGNPIEVNPYKLKQKHHFCSNDCSYNWRKESGLKGKKHPKYQRITVECSYCGKSVEKKAFRIKRKLDKHHFCSKECHNKWMREEGPHGKEHHNYRRIEIKCEQCGTVKIKARKHYKKSTHHFCSKECYMEWMSGRKPYNYARIKTNCDFCGKELSIKRCHLKAYTHHFCNSKCFGEWKSENWSGDDSVFWKGGISFDPYTKEFNSKLKKQIRIRDSFTCQLCSAPENGENHTCHHIDYNKKNSKPDNLILLCRLCNSRVNHNREYWINYFKEILDEKNIPLHM